MAMKADLRNHWCPKCHEWRGIGDRWENGSCKMCGAKCEWRRYAPKGQFVTDEDEKGGVA